MDAWMESEPQMSMASLGNPDDLLDFNFDDSHLFPVKNTVQTVEPMAPMAPSHFNCPSTTDLPPFSFQNRLKTLPSSSLASLYRAYCDDLSQIWRERHARPDPTLPNNGPIDYYYPSSQRMPSVVQMQPTTISSEAQVDSLNHRKMWESDHNASTSIYRPHDEDISDLDRLADVVRWAPDRAEGEPQTISSSPLPAPEPNKTEKFTHTNNTSQVQSQSTASPFSIPLHSTSERYRPQSHSASAQITSVQEQNGYHLAYAHSIGENLVLPPTSYDSGMGLLFACPFFKRDPVVYKTCRTCGFGYILAMRQHLYRVHHTSYGTSKSTSRVHLLPLPALPLQSQLNDWFGAYSLLFPDQSRPDTCYADPSIEGPEVISYDPATTVAERLAIGCRIPTMVKPALARDDDFTGTALVRRRTAKKWICVEPAKPKYPRALFPLSGCQDCCQQKKYSAYRDAVAHLRLCHFIGWPGIVELEYWTMEVEEHVTMYGQQEGPSTSDEIRRMPDKVRMRIRKIRRTEEEADYPPNHPPGQFSRAALSSRHVERMEITKDQSSKLGDPEETEVKSIVPFTDSGYKSAPNIGRYPSVQAGPQQSRSPLKKAPGMSNDDEDDRTVYSLNSTIDFGRAQKCVVDLASDMFGKLRSNGVDPDHVSVLPRVLPDLIKAFALKICDDCLSAETLSIMHFIHKRHQEIISQLQAILNLENADEPDHDRGHREDMPVADKIDMWNSRATEEFSPVPQSELFEGVKDEDEEPIGDNELSQYYTAILKSEAYHWFLTNLAKESMSQVDTPQSRIRQCILDRLPTGTISKRRKPDIHQVTIALEWLRSMEERLKLELSEESTCLIRPSGQSIIITGSPLHAQGLTIKQYLAQTWPVIGIQLLHALKTATNCPQQSHGNVQLEIRAVASRLVVTTTGPAYFVAECCELLAWTGSALLSSGQSPSLCCLPLISNFNIDTTSSAPPLVKHKISCTIKFKLTWLGSSEGSPEAKNFSLEFLRKSALILGFPIRKRPEDYVGLELTFDAMLDHLDTTNEKLLAPYLSIKGPAKKILMIKRADDIFLWRLANSSTDRHSAWQNSVNLELTGGRHPIEYRDLAAGRHIICESTTVAVPMNGLLPAHDEPPALDSAGSQPHSPVQAGLAFDLLGDCRTGKDPWTARGDNLTASGELSDDSGSLSVDCEPSPGTDSSEDSLDSDMFSMSDSSDCVEAKGLPLTAHPLIQKIARQLVDGFRTSAQYQSSSSSCANQPSGIPSVTTSNSTTTASRVGDKRALLQDDEDSTGEDGSSRRPKKIKPDPRQKYKKYFACPFLKKDETTHGTCCKYLLRRIRDVKSHLHRIHTPARYCQRCQATDFQDEQSLQAHIEYGQCPLKHRTTLEGISYEQRNRLHKKSKPGTSEPDQWFVIWDVLFPGHQKPSSVYAESGFVQRGCDYHEYCKNHGVPVMMRVIQSSRALLSSDITEEQRNIMLTRAVAEGFNEVFEDWHSTITRSIPNSERGRRTQDSQCGSPTNSLVDSAVAMGASTFSEGALSERTRPPPSFVGDPAVDRSIRLPTSPLPTPSEFSAILSASFPISQQGITPPPFSSAVDCPDQNFEEANLDGEEQDQACRIGDGYEEIWKTFISPAGHNNSTYGGSADVP